MKKFIKLILIIISILNLSACDILVKDEPASGIKSIPLQYQMDNFSYTDDFSETKLDWSLSLKDYGDLELIAKLPLCNRSEIEVSDINISGNDIILKLHASQRFNKKIRRPKFNITIRGLNPFIKDEYDLIINADFDFISTNLSKDQVIDLVVKENLTLSPYPHDISLKKNPSNGKLMWQLHFLNFTDEIVDMEFVVDDSDKNIIDYTKKATSNKISNGDIIDFISEDEFLYSDDNLYCYNIPKNTKSQLKLKLNAINLSARDIINDELFIYSKAVPESIFLIKNHRFNNSVDAIALPAGELLDMSSHGSGSFILIKSKNDYKKESYNIYQFIDGKYQLKFSTNKKILSINAYYDDFVIELMRGEDSEIIRFDDKSRSVFIGNGSHPIITSDGIYYLKDNKNINRVDLIKYSLLSGLNSTIHSSNISEIDKFNDNSILIKEKVDSLIKLSTYTNDILKEIIIFPDTNLFINNDQELLLFERNKMIWKLRINDIISTH
ncbi:MAG: hypothetical protein MR314_03995 [Ezakiella sp.]|nr:hypothetical protein [Ezakiella sp.]